MKNKILEIKNVKFEKGFTLIELMIVITVIAILAGMVLFGLGAAQRSARDVQREQIMKAVQTALQQYASDNQGAYPATPTTWDVLFSQAGPPPGLNTYLTTAIKDPGCGTYAGVADIRTASAGLGCAAGASPNPKYEYVTGIGTGSPCLNASGYTLTLTKESGGKIYFCSPQ